MIRIPIILLKHYSYLLRWGCEVGLGIHGEPGARTESRAEASKAGANILAPRLLALFVCLPPPFCLSVCLPLSLFVCIRIYIYIYIIYLFIYIYIHTCIAYMI